MTPRLSIVIVNFNGGGHLDNCLASLDAHPTAAATEIVVVDNASTDGSAAAVARFPKVRLVPLAENRGFSAGNNEGIRVSSGELILLLNNDTVVPAGALDRLVGRLDAHPEAAVAGPRLVDGEGRAELSFGPMISPLGELRQKVVTGLHARGFGPVSRWVDARTRREGYVDWVSGACLLVRRRVSDAVGGLDERFFLYTEDVDFCHAVRKLGRKVLFTPVATITHLRGRSRATQPEASRRAYRESKMAFYEKHRPLWTPVLKLYLLARGEWPIR